MTSSTRLLCLPTSSGFPSRKRPLPLCVPIQPWTPRCTLDKALGCWDSASNQLPGRLGCGACGDHQGRPNLEEPLPRAQPLRLGKTHRYFSESQLPPLYVEATAQSLLLVWGCLWLQNPRTPWLSSHHRHSLCSLASWLGPSSDSFQLRWI